MCEYLDFKVVALKRIRIMNIKLEGMRPGEWRDLEADELDVLKKSLKH